MFLPWSMRINMVDACSVKNEEAANNGQLFNTSECLNKSSEYYVGVTLFGRAFFEPAKRNAACVLWANQAQGGTTYC